MQINISKDDNIIAHEGDKGKKKHIETEILIMKIMSEVGKKFASPDGRLFYKFDVLVLDLLKNVI